MEQRSAFFVGEAFVRPTLNTITQGGGAVRVEPRVMEVLVRLAECPGEVLPREALLEAGWPAGLAPDEGLTKAVSALRQALGDSAASAAVIQTIPKRGYRLVAPVRPADREDEADERARTSAPPSVSAPTGSARVRPLRAGGAWRAPRRLSAVRSDGARALRRGVWAAVVLLGLTLSAQAYLMARPDAEPVVRRVRILKTIPPDAAEPGDSSSAVPLLKRKLLREPAAEPLAARGPLAQR